MIGYTPVKGQSWIDQIFTRAAVARRGGPVRRSKASIEKSASLARAYHAALKRGWNVVEVGSDWHFYDASLPIRRVTGPPIKGAPLIGS